MMEQVVAEMIRQSQGETEYRVNLNRILLHKESDKNPLLSHFADERVTFELEVDVDLVSDMTCKGYSHVSISMHVGKELSIFLKRNDSLMSNPELPLSVCTLTH